jgi:hypothetical protein
MIFFIITNLFLIWFTVFNLLKKVLDNDDWGAVVWKKTWLRKLMLCTFLKSKKNVNETLGSHRGGAIFFTMSLPLIWCTVLKPFINFTSTYWPGATRVNFGMRMRTETSTLQWVLTAKKKYLLFRQSYFRSVQGKEKVIVDIIYYRLYLCTEWKLLGVEDVFLLIHILHLEN